MLIANPEFYTMEPNGKESPNTDYEFGDLYLHTDVDLSDIYCNALGNNYFDIAALSVYKTDDYDFRLFKRESNQLNTFAIKHDTQNEVISIIANFAIVGADIADDHVYLLGTEYPEMFPYLNARTGHPTPALIVTEKCEDGTFQDVIYNHSYKTPGILEPYTRTYLPGSNGYEHVARRKKSHAVPIYDTTYERFAKSVYVRQNTIILVYAYGSTSESDVIFKALNNSYLKDHPGFTKNFAFDENKVPYDGIEEAIRNEVDSGRAMPRVFILGANRITASVIRSEIDKIIAEITAERQKPKQEVTKPETPRDPKPKEKLTGFTGKDRMKEKSPIDNFDFSSYGSLEKKPKKRRGDRRKRDYHNKYDY